MSYFAALIILTFPIAFLFGCVVFKDWEDFLEALKHILTPDIVSALSGDWHEDQWNTMKVHIVLIVWAIVAMSAHFKWSDKIRAIMETVGL